MAVFTGDVDKSILHLWNKINLSMYMRCLPSQIDSEASRDIQAVKVILNAREEMRKREQGSD